jgi:hypothetical protein
MTDDARSTDQQSGACYRCRTETRGLEIEVPNGSVRVCASCAPTVSRGELA